MLIERTRFAIARDAAISKHTNPRNFEHVWYPFWQLVSNRLGDRVDPFNFYVAPQYPLWRVWMPGDEDNVKPCMTQVDEDDEESDDANEGGDEDSDDETEGSDDEDEHDVEMFGAANTSVSTVADTIKIRDRKRVTDFALLFWKEEDARTLLGELSPVTEHAIFSAAQPTVTPYLKLLEYIPLLIEVKRQPSRSDMGSENWRFKMRVLISKAKEDVLLQVRLLTHSTLIQTNLILRRPLTYSAAVDGYISGQYL